MTTNTDAVPQPNATESTLDLARDFAIAYDDSTVEFDEDSLGRFVDVLRVEIARELYVAPTAEQAEVHSIEGTVRFLREENPENQRCICCPPKTGHIFARGVNWDEWKTNHPAHFGNGPEVFVSAKVTDFNRNEGRRIRLTVEILPLAATAPSTGEQS